MDIYGITAVVFVLITVVAIVFRPQIIIGVQVFSTPIIGLALQSLGIGIGAVNMIFALTALSLLTFIYYRKRLHLLPTSPLEIGVILFISWVAVTLTYTPSPNYGLSKLLALMVIAFPCIYVARLYCNTPARLLNTIVSNGWYAIFLLIFFTIYVFFNSFDQTRIRSSFFGPLVLGYNTVSMIPFIFLVFVSSKDILLKAISIVAIACAIYVMLATGSRGPFFALVTASLLSLLRFKYFYRTLMGLVVAAIALFVYIDRALKQNNKGVERILKDTQAGSNSTEGRFELYTFAIDQFTQYPLFGQGSGSFSYFAHHIDTRLYAHNTFLEIAGEFGLVGLFIFISVLAASIVQIQLLRLRSLKMPNNYYWAIASIQAIFFIGVINACFSFEFSLQRILFLGIGLLAATTQWRRKPTRRNQRLKLRPKNV